MYMYTRVYSIFLIAGIISIGAFATPNTAAACSCANISQEEMYENADAVFVGSVISRKEKDGGFKEALHALFGRDKPRHYTYNKIDFHVTERWKGVDTNKITIVTALHSASCGFNFKKGEEYLVYAHESPAYDEKLSTSICSRTTLLSEASEDLAALGPGDTTFTNEELRHDPLNDSGVLKVVGKPADVIRKANYTILTGSTPAAFGVLALYFTPPVLLGFVLRRRFQR